MSDETLVSLLRAEDRRINAARRVGDWEAMREAIERRQKWEDQYAKGEQ